MSQSVVKRHTASMEDYLEVIVMLRPDNQPVRVSQISNALGVKMPSVTAALKRLSDDGLVNHERYGFVTLTMRGRKLAKDVFHRHETVRYFLSEILQLEPEIAAGDACRIEHNLSPETVNRLTEFMKFVVACPMGQPLCLEEFANYIKYGRRSSGMCACDCSSRRAEGSSCSDC